MIIDSHAHVSHPIKDYLNIMSETGIDRAILFATSVHPEKSGDTESFEAEMGRLELALAGGTPQEVRANAMRELVETVGQRPDRFAGFCSVPLGLTYEETGGWVEDYVVKNRCIGFGEITAPAGSVKLLSTILALAADFGNLPVWVHAFTPLQLSDIRELMNLARAYPSVPLIVGHLGGLNWLDTIKLAKECKNVYLDLSATLTRFAPLFAVRELPHRTIFSSDYPYGDPYALKIALERVTRDGNVRERVMGGTILSLLSGWSS